jgi:hypothetical protein
VFFASDAVTDTEIYHGDPNSQYTIIVLCPTELVEELQRHFPPRFCADFLGDIARELLQAL